MKSRERTYAPCVTSCPNRHVRRAVIPLEANGDSAAVVSVSRPKPFGSLGSDRAEEALARADAQAAPLHADLDAILIPAAPGRAPGAT